jgi:phosphatidate cytidylyltransferase
VSARAARPLVDMGLRTVTAVALGVVILGVLFYGGVWGIAGVVAVIAALAVSEFYALARRERRRLNEFVGLLATVALPLVAVPWGLTGISAVIAALVIASLVWHVLIPEVRLADTAVTVFGAAYVGFTLAHLVLVRQLAEGTLLVLIMLLGVWANDVLAYTVGTAVGRHHLAPAISPKKTWEGLAAGTLGTVAVWVIGGTLLDLAVDTAWLVAIGLAASLAAVIGDLAESRIKREVDTKDSGRLLPGHGGFLDRFDASIMISIVTYYLLLAAGVR